MIIAGLLLLLAGWIIAVAACLLLRSLPLMTIFVLIALAIEALGFSLIAKSHTSAGSKVAG